MFREEELCMLYNKLCNNNLTKFKVFIKKFLKENKKLKKLKLAKMRIKVSINVHLLYIRTAM